jgi:tetratricopeptide (TPR) repeat protein/glycosyltransferase involved in cell wall biosynthesis
MSHSENSTPTIVFISELCVLDRKSGAAQTVRALLMGLAKAGWQCHSITMAKFDGDEEYPMNLGPSSNGLREDMGEWQEIPDDKVMHHVMNTHSTLTSRMRPWEVHAFLESAKQRLSALQPDLVLGYGSEQLNPLWAHAGKMGTKTVFYLANGSYAQPKAFVFKNIDEFVVPSQASARLYKDSMGLDASVLRDLVEAPLDGRINLAPQRLSTRKQRYVTMINPAPAKGGLLFLNVVAQLQKMAPDVKCRVVESRWGKAQWLKEGVAVDQLTHLEWHPFTQDMKKVYEEAAVLLVPSLWFEASGRVIAEALQAGVPIMAMNSGGIAEQLNKGGFLFEAPEAMRQNYAATPPSEVLNQWTQFVHVLMNNDSVYQRSVQLALQAGQVHERSQRDAQAVQLFEDLVKKPLIVSSGDPSMDALPDISNKMDRLREAVNQTLESTSSGQALEDLNLEEAREPYAEVLKLSMVQAPIQQGLSAIRQGKWQEARTTLENYLRHVPRDLVALGLLASVVQKEGDRSEALELMERLIELAPGFEQAQIQFLQYAKDSQDTEKALRLSAQLLKRAGHQRRYQALHAALLVGAHRFEEAIEIYAQVLDDGFGRSHDWMQYGLALKTVGHQQQAVDAYRTAIQKNPQRGASWHGLSNTKLAVFTDEDVRQMKFQLGQGLSEEDQLNFHFTLGKAYEDSKTYEQSFTHYAQANAIRQKQSQFDVGRVEAFVQKVKEVMSAEFFESRRGQGCPSKAPVFVLGMHRAGSTLTEQILASHSQIEGTRELPHLLSIGRAFGSVASNDFARPFLAPLLLDVDADEWTKLGEKYLEKCSPERQTNRPLFVDKMPANWMYTGLIHLMLPRAKIIDVRRAPMSAGFALFKMNFGRGVDYSYSQEDIARYYLAYTDLMAHFDQVLPGRVHHLSYESLVENTDQEIKRLIDYCGLPFEDNCLRYWETERAVQTPSSEQVRKPIYKEAMAQWKNYEPWLGPMKAAFGLGGETATAGVSP